MCRPLHAVYLFTHWWTLRLSPPFGYCGECCCEHGDTFLNPWARFFWVCAKEGVGRARSTSDFNFWRNCPSSAEAAVLHLHQQSVRAPRSPCPHPHMQLSVLLMSIIPAGAQPYFFETVICIATAHVERRVVCDHVSLNERGTF